MPLSDLLTSLRRDHGFMANVTAWRSLPAQPAQLAPILAQLHPVLIERLQQRGIDQLYSHQQQSIYAALEGQNVVVTTPTASGKTLCYNLPVFETLLRDPAARALYLFPTKALAHDQLDEIREWGLATGDGGRQTVDDSRGVVDPAIRNFLISTYDGDTPSADRARIRKSARIILSNPDMLHAGILPYHTQWGEFLSGLRFVVIDEMHSYRGVFGSHVANVLRRLQRICHFYGSQPRFILTSATIANPGQLAERLIEQPVIVVSENGAPRGEKHVIIYTPPMLDAESGIRRSALLEASELASRCVLGGVQTIVFARARQTVELLLTYLRESLRERLHSVPGQKELWRAEAGERRPKSGDWRLETRDHNSQSTILNPQSQIRGYRGGYLPEQRRAIEAGLRSGEVRAVVTTNALELGIDIGQLQAAVLCGYPGSIASTWQQMGRAGRTQEAALAILVATGQPIDQYLSHHPEFLFERSPEQALINPDNLMLLVDQMRCASFELPFRSDASFGNSPFTNDVFDLLVEEGNLRRYGPRLMWSGAGYPSHQIGLRSADNDPVVIQVRSAEFAMRNAQTGEQRVEAGGWRAESTEQEERSTIRNSQFAIRNQILGEMDAASAPAFIHDGAIYMHEGETYRVDQLNLEQRIAQVTPVNVDFYTTSDAETTVEVLTVHDQKTVPTGRLTLAHGELRVVSQITGYRRVRRQTQETLGQFPLDYPPTTLETSGYWFSVGEAAQRILALQGSWFDSINDYGPNWQEQRQKVRRRDYFRCTQCDTPEGKGRKHDVHHVRPFRTFGYVPGINETYKQANLLNNLLLVCQSCHQRLESSVRTRGALDGLGYVINNIAPIYLMCDRSDIGIFVERAEASIESEVRNAECDQSGDSTLPTLHSVLVTPPPPFPTPPPALPTIYIYERISAGLGFTLRLFEIHNELLSAAHELIAACPCHNGCPACVGPVLDNPLGQLETKRLTLALLAVLISPLQVNA